MNKIRRPSSMELYGMTSEQITDVSVEVYKLRLEDKSGGGPGAVARMLEKDEDNGEKLRGRASAYNPLTRAYLTVLAKMSGPDKI